MTRARPLIVGELNPYGSDPDYALTPYPRGASGDRLRDVMGLSDRVYLAYYDRANLCAGRWSAKKARERAVELLYRKPVCDVFVLLGKKVAEAFALDYEPYTARIIVAGVAREAGAVLLPHPSGRNRMWNLPTAVEDARRALRQITWALPTQEDIARIEMPRTEWTTARPARCSNCGIVVEKVDCPDCGPM